MASDCLTMVDTAGHVLPIIGSVPLPPRVLVTATTITTITTMMATSATMSRRSGVGKSFFCRRLRPC